ncbi:hypothetical protein QQ045_012307 [Rhodiola kirilowii]
MVSGKSDEAGMAAASTIAEDTGQSRLSQLGYKQELKRDLSMLSNFAFSFSITSALTGVTTLYNNGLTYGGPATMVYGGDI